MTPTATRLLQTALLCIALLGSVSEATARVDITNVDATVTTEKQQEHPERDRVTVEITYDLEGTVGEKGAVIAIDATLRSAEDPDESRTIRPLDSELEGDFGGVVGDGSKTVVWDATATLERLGMEGEHVCVIDVSAEGQGDAPTQAVLTINEYDPQAGHSYFATGTVVMKDLDPVESSAICPQADRWETTVDGDADFYQGDVSGFPTYRGRFPSDQLKGAVGGEHCSGFLAAKDLGTAEEKIWINFTGEFSKTASVNGTPITANYVFQIRYNRIRTGSTVKEFIKVGNAGKPGQEGSFAESPAITKYDVHIEIGKEDVESSHGFDLNVPLYELDYRYEGVTTLRFEGVDGSYFKSNGAGRLTLEGGKMRVNNWLMYDGPAEIDSTPDNGRLLVTGAWSSPAGKTIWHSSSEAGLTDGFEIQLVDGDAWGLTPEQALAPEWPMSTRSVSFIGGLEATGISTDMLMVIPWMNSGCNERKADKKVIPGGFAVGGLEINDLEYTDEGFDLNRLEAENIGLAPLDRFCMRSLVLLYDKEAKRVDIDGEVVFKPYFDNAKFGITVIDWLPERLALSVKLGEDDAVEIPYPQPYPGHIAEWRGLGVEADNIVTGPFHLAGSAMIGSNKAWSDLPGYATLARVVGDAELFELIPEISYTYPLVMGLKGEMKFLSYKNAWLTNGRKIWIARGTADAKMGISGDGPTISGSIDVKVLDLGGDNPVFQGNASIGLTMGSNFLLSMVMTGDVRFPTLFTDLPVGDYINHTLGLPWVFAQAHAELENTSFTFASKANGKEHCFVLDLSRNPLTEKDQFLKYCNAAAVINSRIEQKGANPAAENDTTWFSFAATPDMILAVAQIWGDPAPLSVLRSPSGSLITTESTVEGVTFYPSTSPGMSSMWELENPEAGIWNLGVIDFTEEDTISTWGRYSPIPDFSFEAAQAGSDVTATWEPHARNEEAVVNFFLDTDQEGFNGQFIGSAPEADGSFSFQLSDSLMECGYYIYGRRNDNGYLSSTYDGNGAYLDVMKEWLAPPTGIEAVVSHITGEVTVSWEHSTDTSRFGYAIIVTDQGGRDSVYRTVEYGFTLSTFPIEEWQQKSLSIITLGPDGYNGCRSEPVTFQITGVDEEPRSGDQGGPELTMHIRPNPTTRSASIFVNLEQRDLLIVELYDLGGKRVETLFVGEHPAGTARAEYDVSELESGTYLLRVTTMQGTATERLVVRH